jgi:hypothetical protein
MLTVIQLCRRYSPVSKRWCTVQAYEQSSSMGVSRKGFTTTAVKANTATMTNMALSRTVPFSRTTKPLMEQMLLGASVQPEPEN